MNGNMHLTGFLQWRELNGKTSVLTRNCSIFFQTSRELFGNESNKIVVFRPGSPFLSWESSSNSHHIYDGCAAWCVFPTLTSRWRHWSGVFSRTAFSVCWNITSLNQLFTVFWGVFLFCFFEKQNKKHKFKLHQHYYSGSRMFNQWLYETKHNVRCTILGLCAIV